MKSSTKSILFAAVALSAAVSSQAAVQSFDSGEIPSSVEISSSVEFSDDVYHYSYVLAAQPEDHDLSHVTIEIGICESFRVAGSTTIPHQILIDRGVMKFDDLRVSGAEPVEFTIASPHPPRQAELIAKAGRDSFVATVPAPDCSAEDTVSIPEPGPLLFCSLGALALISRRRR